MILSRRRVLIGASAFIAAPAILKSKLAFGQSARTLLTADTPFYASPSGISSNDGLSVSTPWPSLQFGLNAWKQHYDFGGRNVSLYAAAGTYAEALAVNGQFVGQEGPGSVSLIGCNVVGGTTCLIAAPGTSSTGFPAIQSLSGAHIYAKGFAISSPVGGLSTARQSELNFDGIEFQSCGGYHIHAGPASCARAFDNYWITGDANVHWDAAYGQVQLNTTGPTGSGTPYATIIGHRTFNNFVSLIEGALGDFAGGPGIFYVPPGGANSVTCAPYNIGSLSKLYLNLHTGWTVPGILPGSAAPTDDGTNKIW